MNNDNVNTPNALTLLRIAITPLLVVTIVSEAWAAAAAIFAVGMATDVLDGHLARSRGCETTFGRLFDPAADKLLVGSAFVGLAVADRVALWIVVVILTREVLVSVLRQVAQRRGVVVGANRLGKAKTGLQTLMILVLILAPDPGAAWVLALLGATVVATVLSGLSYAAALTAEGPGREPAAPSPGPLPRPTPAPTGNAPR